MPRKNTKPVGTNVSDNEYEAIKRLASLHGGIAEYIRRLIVEDFEERKIKWPGETAGRAKEMATIEPVTDEALQQSAYYNATMAGYSSPSVLLEKLERLNAQGQIIGVYRKNLLFNTPNQAEMITGLSPMAIAHWENGEQVIDGWI